MVKRIGSSTARASSKRAVIRPPIVPTMLPSATATRTLEPVKTMLLQSPVAGSP